jgi:HD-like signal output (HDOD) protein/CheY-like chemotaxis protein
MSTLQILLIDDDPAIRRALTRALPPHGFQVHSVASAREAVSALGEESYDLILVDLHMPEIPGRVFVREIARMGIRIPVVVLSGTQKVREVIDMMRLGVSDFVHKPFQMEELVASLRRAADQSQSSSARPSRPKSTELLEASSLAITRNPIPDDLSDDYDSSVETVADRPPPPGPATSGIPTLRTQTPNGEVSSPQDTPILVRDLLRDLKEKKLKLPVLDPRVSEIQRFISNQEAGIDELLNVIGRDPALSASVLQVANSGYYSSGARAFENLRDASVRIGNKQVLSVAMQVLIRSAFSSSREPFRTLMSRAWENHLLTAKMARGLALACEDDDPEEIYVAALLHNSGELGMLQLLSEIYDEARHGPVDLRELAHSVAQHHERFGKALGSAWSLPRFVRRMAACHHQAPPHEGLDERRRRHIILAAWSIACERTPEYLAAGFALPAIEYASYLPLTAAAFDARRSELIHAARKAVRP